MDAKLGKGQQAGSPLNNSVNHSRFRKVRVKYSNHSIQLHVILPPLFFCKNLKKKKPFGMADTPHLHQHTDSNYLLQPAVTLEDGSF